MEYVNCESVLRIHLLVGEEEFNPFSQVSCLVLYKKAGLRHSENSLILCSMCCVELGLNLIVKVKGQRPSP